MRREARTTMLMYTVHVYLYTRIYGGTIVCEKTGV